MAIKMGPILGFRGQRQGEWRVSALLVTDAQVDAPALAFATAGGAKASATATSLKATPEGRPSARVWRWDIAVRQTDAEQRVGYEVLGIEAEFWVPAKGSLPNAAYASCNGFSSAKVKNSCKVPQQMWGDLAAAHAERHYHLLLMGGDQVYADSIWEVIPELREWAGLPVAQAVKRAFTADMARKVDQFYRGLYIENWGQKEPATVLARIPTLMMWDDHDIFDGWGSYSPELQGCAVHQGLFKIARDYFALYQLQLDKGETHPLAIPASTSFAYGCTLESTGDHAMAILALDMRGDRDDAQIIAPANWKAVYDWLDALPDDHRSRHLLILSSIPVVHPDFSLIEKTLSIFPGRQELEDDLRDHWNSPAHQQERLRFIHRLFALSQARQYRVTLLSGDVHVGAVGVVTSARDGAGDRSAQVITQLTSSGIVHPAPPGVMLFFLESVMAKQRADDRDIASEMTPFPGTRTHYIGTRNWLALEPDESGRLWANWHVENIAQPYTKVIHPIGYKMLG
jgi:hypothetical protein